MSQKSKAASRKNIQKAIKAHKAHSKHNGKDTDGDNR